MHAWTIAAAPFFLAASVAVAAECAPGETDRARVSEVLDRVSLKLSDGREVRLAGVVIPPDVVAAARAAVTALAAGKDVMVSNLGGHADRYGRLPVHVFVEGGGWVQGELLRRGLAITLTFQDERACAAALLAAEDAGRQAGAGLWAHPDFAIAAADNPPLLGPRNRYQIAEGRVLSVGKTHTTVYLDFGRNWATDFTVTVSTSDAALFESEGLALDGLEGRRVRVRGWLVESNGPMIRVDHPEQIELLER